MINDYLNIELFRVGKHIVTMYVVVLPILLFILARLTNWLILRFALAPYFIRMEFSTAQRRKVKVLLASVLTFFSMWVSVEVLFAPPIQGTDLDFWGKLMPALQILFASLSILYGFQLIIWLLNDVILKRYFKTREIDIGRQFTVTRLIIYVGFVIGIFSILQVLGVNLSWLIGGSAALLVGIGLGLQQTFNDLISGIIILVEGTVEVGDIIKINDFVAVVKKIGLRVSQVETRDNSILLIPNSKLVLEDVNNWSHNLKPTRFQIDIGVSYSSDVRLVEKLLLQTANDHSRVSKKPRPRVQFRDFGNSSLDFTLHFHSVELMSVEFTKSDIRFNIIHLLRENNIEIPFPQQDIWLRNAEVLQAMKEKPSEEGSVDLEDETVDK
ncbi:MAG: small-conductance mechanosensitive channel [Saprospiraceae bacterium]|jgi:small-conductance mechanosensitive channel